MVFRFLIIVCAFPIWGGQDYPVPPLCVSSGTWLVSFSFMLAFGRALVLLWEGGGVAWGGVGGGWGWCGGVGVASCYLPEQG